MLYIDRLIIEHLLFMNIIFFSLLIAGILIYYSIALYSLYMLMTEDALFAHGIQSNNDNVEFHIEPQASAA